MDEQKMERLCESLMAQIEAVVGDDARRMQSEEERRLETSWHVGQLILKAEHAAKLADIERSRLMDRLSSLLKARYGKRYGVRNVYYMRKFASLYKKPNADAALSWTHYRLLMQVEDDSVRETLERQAADNAMPYRQLETLVAETVGFEAVSAAQVAKVLSPSVRHTGLYKVVRGTQGIAQLDVGFDVWLPADKPLPENVREGDLVQKVNGRYVVVPFSGSARYAFHGYVLRVVDGDTLLLEVILGERASGRFRFRLRGVDAMEAGTAWGEKATRYVNKQLPAGTPVLIHSYGHDKYGRYVVDIFYGGKEIWKHADKGRYLNRELVEAGLVRLVR